MTAGGLAMGVLTLAGGLYLVYRLGVWLEQRHQERCFLCAGMIDLKPRDWRREGHYWDSRENRWAHSACKLEQVEQYRKAGGL